MFSFSAGQDCKRRNHPIVTSSQVSVVVPARFQIPGACAGKFRVATTEASMKLIKVLPTSTFRPTTNMIRRGHILILRFGLASRSGPCKAAERPSQNPSSLS
jgi:hypothetical protein